MKEEIEKIIKENNLDVDAVSYRILYQEPDEYFGLSITLGTNEGYYVNITKYISEPKDFTDRRCRRYGITYSLRIHSRDEAIRTFECLSVLVPNN
jgi:hypothetical protein